MWLLLALLAPALYAVSNVFDTFLANKKFKNPFSLVFYVSLFNLVFIPLLFLFERPDVPGVETLPIFLLLGLINVGYLYPYYRALQNDDTSVVVAFFSLSRIFIPALAFFIVGEILQITQYVGIFLIVAGVAALSLHRDRAHFRLSKASGYMALAACILAFEGVLLKYLFEQGVNVSTALGGEMLVSVILSALLLIPQGMRRDIVAHFGSFRQTFRLFLAEESFAFLGFVAEGYAIALAPVSLVKGITTLAPFFLLLYAEVLERHLPNVFREDLKKMSVIRKSILFALIVLGVVLVRN